MKLFLICIMLFCNSIFVFCETKRVSKEEKANDWELEFGLTNQTAGSFHNYLGDKISQLPRTFVFDSLGKNLDTINGRYNFNYNSYIYNFRLNYKTSQKLTLSAYIPISYYSLEEKGSYDYISKDQNGYQSSNEKKVDSTPTFSKTQIEYIGLALNYTLLGFEKNDKTKLSFDLDMRLPLGKEKQINRSDLINGFVYDGSFEFLFSPDLTINFKGLRINSNIKYHYRNEDLKDLIHLNNKFSLTNDPNIDINFFANYTFNPNKNTSTIEKEFYPRFTQTFEQYAEIGAGIKVRFSNSFAFDSGYFIRVYNNHSWNNTSLFLKAIFGF